MARERARSRSSSGDGGSGKDDHSKHRKYHHSRSRDRNSRERSRSRSPERRQRGRSSRERSRSRSPERRKRGRSSRERSRSWSPEKRQRGRGRSRSRSPEKRQRARSSKSLHSRSPSRERGERGKHYHDSSRNRGGGKSRRSPSPKWEREKREDSGNEHDLTNNKEGEQLQKQAMIALAAIQDGSKKAKRVIVKQRGKFDWENTEDTSQDMIPICHGQLLFGRGFYAGMDRREQKKQSAKIEREVKGHQDIKSQKQSSSVYDPFDDMPVDRHWSEKELHEMTARDWRIFREDYNISYKGSKFPQPARNWEEPGICPELLKAVYEAGYKKPTPIQMAAIPLGLKQRDVIGIAGTGSGKTAAFVIPMLMYISKLPRMSAERAADGPYALVLAPTTELAQQIQEETVKLAQHMEINVVSLIAGESISDQSSRLLHGCEIVIATPGRLLHCLEQGYAVLNQCNYVVLDEGDRMIDLGFEEQVIEALNAMPSSNLKPENADEPLEENRIYRTTYMFSATMPPAVERLAKKYMRNPVVVTIEEASKRISQRVMMIDEEEKPKRLRRLLDELGDMSTIVFVNTKKQADKVSKQLHDLGIKVATIHGGKTQQKRQTNFQDFRSKRRSCLIATDVVGRGIDIPDVGHVINYDMPNSIEMYIHRIGRTGRAGKSGAATTFLTLNDQELFYDLKQLLVRTKNPVPPELARHEAAKVKPVKANWSGTEAS